MLLTSHAQADFTMITVINVSVTTYVLPYAWYIWRTLSLAIWEQTQVG